MSCSDQVTDHLDLQRKSFYAIRPSSTFPMPKSLESSMSLHEDEKEHHEVEVVISIKLVTREHWTELMGYGFFGVKYEQIRLNYKQADGSVHRILMEWTGLNDDLKMLGVTQGVSKPHVAIVTFPFSYDLEVPRLSGVMYLLWILECEIKIQDCMEIHNPFESRGVCCPVCTSSGRRGEGKVNPTVLSEVTSDKMKIANGYKYWLKAPESLDNSAIGLHILLKPTEDWVKKIILRWIPFYHALEDCV
ncbi:hypothetical protein RHGRI_013073 [Rhododendron griersonianum]|uniref:Uncharacterized protein n=1 Tax=Rhododendron griersonianum TaxID=479676 RepID=A0AAV6K4A2_9ERIC|nr:hypothetical protein RHGRI_013073 [Rhododendron griersonianum]